MQAAVNTTYGGPGVLEIKEVEKPACADNQLLIRVRATTVNRTDCAILTAKPFIMRFFMGLFKPKNIIGGTDFAGEIEAIGKSVTSFKAGDKVFGFDDSGISSHAEYMSLAADKALATIPGNANYEQAAASIEGAHYAYNFINKVKVGSGQKVLVNGATGAIGSAAVQLLKYFDVYVIAVCNTNGLALAKSLGADEVIDYTKTDFTKGDEKYDFIFDTVGKSSFGKCKPLLKPGGAYISSELGRMSQNLFLAIATSIGGKKKVIFPVPGKIKESVLLVKKLIEDEKFRPLIDRIYPLDEIADAYKYVLTGQKMGNVVITI